MLHPVALTCEPTRMQNELHVSWSVTYNGAVHSDVLYSICFPVLGGHALFAIRSSSLLYP
jgi:hypothetical protein